MGTAQTVLSPEQMNTFLREVFPELGQQFGEQAILVEQTSHNGITMRLRATPSHLRPGGTISGPSIFLLADLSLYAAINATMGRQEQSVTTNINLNFLRRSELQDLIGTATILKAGRRLVIGDCHITGADDGKLVAHATLTYALPPA